MKYILRIPFNDHNEITTTIAPNLLVTPTFAHNATTTYLYDTPVWVDLDIGVLQWAVEVNEDSKRKNIITPFSFTGYLIIARV